MTTNFDYIVFGILIISLLVGLCRGFMRELLGLLSWVAAGFAMVYLTPILKEEFFKDKSAVMQIGLGIGVAIAVLIVMTFIIYFVTNKIRTSPLNALDRMLGMLFGFIRGAVLVLAAYLAIDIVTPKYSGEIFNEKTGLTAPFIVTTGNFIKKEFPDFFKKVDETKDKTADKIKKETKKATDKLIEQQKEELQKKLNSPEAEKKANKSDKKDYSDKERSAMDKLFSSHND